MENRSDKLRVIITAGIILMVAGIIVICLSTSIGNEAGNAALRQAGSTDTSRYQFIKETTAESCQIIGALCTAIGGYAAVKFGCLWFKEKAEQN